MPHVKPIKNPKRPGRGLARQGKGGQARETFRTNRAAGVSRGESARRAGVSAASLFRFYRSQGLSGEEALRRIKQGSR